MLYITRTGPPYFETVVDNLKKNIPKLSIVYAGDTIDSVISLKTKLSYAPVFGKYYLIILKYMKDKELYKFLKWATVDVKYIKVVMYCKNKIEYQQAINKSEMSKVPYVSYDPYKASKRDKNLYIEVFMAKFGIILKPADLDLIRRRLAGYSSEINSMLQSIANLPEINRKSIMKTIPKRSDLNPNSFGFLLYSEDYDIDDFLELLRDNQYSVRLLTYSVRVYTEKLLKLYKMYLMGEFTEMNYKTFVINCGEKYGVQTNYHAQIILDIYSRYSYPKLLTIASMIEDVGNTRLSHIILLEKLILFCRG